MEVASLADFAGTHGPSITARSAWSPHRTTGGSGTRHMDARQSGSTPEEASAAAGRYMADVKHVLESPSEHQTKPGGS